MLEWYGRVGVNLNDVRPYIYIKVVMIAVFRRKYFLLDSTRIISHFTSYKY